MGDEGGLELPEDEALAAAAVALDRAGQWAEIVDDRWGQVYMTSDLRLSMGGVFARALAPPPGAHYFGPEALATRARWRSGPNTVDLHRDLFLELGDWVLADTPGGAAELRQLVDPGLRDLVDQLIPEPGVPAKFYGIPGIGLRGTVVTAHGTAMRVHDATGRRAGTALIGHPPVGTSVLGAAVASGDLRHLVRIQQLAKAAKRPGAVLFADLEGSSVLSRRLSTASYFDLGRRLVVAADRCIIDAGGVVGRHVGDGVTAFFLAETTGSESAAALACISASRALREAVAGVAVRSGVAAEDVLLRFGLHWGGTLFVGQIITGGRSEVTALGDEVNEAARIEACAGGGRALASKALVERLNPDDAARLDLDPDRLTYIQLSQLTTATDKVRRDAPAIAVCDV